MDGPIEIGEGRWHVKTQASLYVIDLDTAVCVRLSLDADSDRRTQPHLPLRRDADEISMLSLEKCCVGEPMVIVLDIRRDGIVTVRRTSQVTSIVQVPPTPAI